MDYQPERSHAQAFQPPQPFPTYGYCDSYFVESHDDDEGIYARAAAERERQRGVARLQQKALAEELTQVTANEYQEDILHHMEAMELETMPDIQSIEIQTEIQWYMRPYLLDFLLEAHHAFGLLPETLHLAVNLLDRYCSKRVVYKRHYQLVGCAALLIAAKYGDRKERVPTIRELKSMCCSLYDDDMFTQMEWHVLQTLNWMVGHPTVSSFLQMAMADVSFDPEVEHMSCYILELALYHKDFIPLRPSMMARCSLALARCILDRPQPPYGSWSAQYDANVILSLSNHLSQPSQALLRKYASPHLSSVSTTIDLFLARQAALATRVVQTPVNELPTIQVHHHQTPPENAYLTPQTPQKHAGFHTIPIGILTPPITPDKDYCESNEYGNHSNAALVQRFPIVSVPTPPPSAQDLHFPPQQYDHYMQQAQMVQ